MRLRVVLIATVLASCGGALTPAEELCLSTSSQALSRVCQGSHVVTGPDVSYYQGAVSWPDVKTAGQVFAIARVSDGTTVRDSRFTANWKGMKSAGLVRGVYQFFRPAQDPLAQAKLLVDAVQAAGGFAAGDLPPVVDVEVIDGVSNATLRANLQQWLTAVERATNKRPIIYTAAFMNSAVGTGFAAYPLWVANYGVTCPSVPDGWNAWKLWQYTSTGTITGISGHVDTNRFNGTLTQLQAFASQVLDAGTAHTDGGHLMADAGQSGPVDAGQRDAGTSADAGIDDGDAGTDADGGQGAVLGSGTVLYLGTCGPMSN